MLVFVWYTLLFVLFSFATILTRKIKPPPLHLARVPTQMSRHLMYMSMGHRSCHNLNLHTASGPDNIPSRLLMETAAEIAPSLAVIKLEYSLRLSDSK